MVYIQSIRNPYVYLQGKKGRKNAKNAKKSGQKMTLDEFLDEQNPRIRKFLLKNKFVYKEAKNWAESALQALTLKDRVQFIQVPTSRSLII